MNFWETAKHKAEMEEISITENGAVGHKTSGHALLDLNFAVASLRNASESEIETKFIKAYQEDPVMAVLWLFYVRDPRGGLGERRLFRICANWLSENQKEVFDKIVRLIPEYGRFDDWWNILPPISAAYFVKEQLKKDTAAMRRKQPISLLAKWMPSINTSSAKSKVNAHVFARSLMLSDRNYRKMLSEMRAYLDVTERKMSSNDWKKIKYESVPSRANLIYNDAFLKHDETRRRKYLDKVSAGETKMNAGVLFPHDIIHSYVDSPAARLGGTDAGLEAMWKSLPDTVQGNGSTIVVADGSGSMMARIGNTSISALEVANALAIYFSEHCRGQFKDRYITFSENPRFVDFSGAKNLIDKYSIARSHNEVANTNIKAVFDLILHTAIESGMHQEDIPANILIISDMEFDSCAVMEAGNGWWRSRDASPNKTLFAQIENEYMAVGYKLPRIIFWNVNSRTATIPLRENDLGVALVSGFSPNICKMVMSAKTDPYELLVETLHSERYVPVMNALNAE